MAMMKMRNKMQQDSPAAKCGIQAGDVQSTDQRETDHLLAPGDRVLAGGHVDVPQWQKQPGGHDSACCRNRLCRGRLRHLASSPVMSL